MSKNTFEDIKDQVIVITGSGSGIGKETAKLFAEKGANIVISDINPEACAVTVKEIQEIGGDAIFTVGNISQEEDVEKIMKSAIEKWGKIDCLVNNAGITKDNLFIRMKKEQWQSVIDVNLTGTYLCCFEAVKYMRKARKGNIINLSSIMSAGNPGQANYAASKAGVIGLSKTLAKELGNFNIRVNSIAPGLVKTPMTEVLSDKAKESYIARIPLKRPAEPREIGNLILFLASNLSSYITGTTISIDGGGF